MKSNIKSLADLAEQTELKYGVLNGGSLFDFFKESKDFPYQTMFFEMDKANSFMNSTKEGVAKVRSGNFAYMTDQPYLDYYNMKKPCNTILLTNLLEGKGYGIGLQRHSNLTNGFSVEILKVGLPTVNV